MDDTTRVANIKGFLAKQGYLRPFRFHVVVAEDVPVIVFESINGNARTRLSDALNAADLNHIRIVNLADQKKK